MPLRLKFLIAGVLVALPVSALIVIIVGSLRAKDQATAIQRIVDAQTTQHAKEMCEADPNWFLAGPREAPPSALERQMPDADVRLPRPSTAELPLEFYAYSEQYEGSSTAAPRFPPELRNALRFTDARSAVAPFPTRDGDGVQMAHLTGWSPGPCAVLLFRLRPYPHQLWQAAGLFAAVFLGCMVVAAVVAGPMIFSITRLARVTRESARNDYAEKAPVYGRDEISSLGAMFNEIGADIRRRITDSRDREEALRRYVAEVTDGVGTPLADLEGEIARLDPRSANAAEARADLARRAHALSAKLLNLAAVTRLRETRERLPRDPVDMNALVTRVVGERAALASAVGVTMTTALPPAPAVIAGDAILFERAIANLVDNAIVYNRPGGRVTVEVAHYDGKGRFSLRVSDTGAGVTDEEFKGLTAIRRFRGDEGRERRPGVPGLGLAIAREVAERFGYGLELRRPPAGGFEAEFAGTGSR